LFLSQASPALGKQSELPVLRGRGLEIIDAQGRIRASINIMPPSRADTGSSETVLLRLVTRRSTQPLLAHGWENVIYDEIEAVGFELRSEPGRVPPLGGDHHDE